jgi:N-acetylglutamate synthase-like GNAT family acetyltransferase
MTQTADAAGSGVPPVMVSATGHGEANPQGHALRVHIEPIGPEELDKVRLRLLADGLPVEDLGRAPVHFFAARTQTGAPVGWGGLEPHGEHALLRSVVVNPVLRGIGAGTAMVEALAQTARTMGIARLWLLTTSAEAFFARLGFDPADRDSAPAAIRASEEFAWHCPETAVCMTRVA